MNLYYYDSYYFWLMIYTQEFTAAAGIINEYTLFLDVDTPTGLLKMQIANCISCIHVLWCRGFYYVWICYQLLRQFYEEKSWNFFYGSVGALLIYTNFNIFFCIIPYFSRCMKFLRYKRKEKGDGGEEASGSDSGGEAEDK